VERQSIAGQQAGGNANLATVRKYLQYLLVLVILLAATSMAQESGRVQRGDRSQLESGQVAGRTYTNDSLGLTYQMPDGFLVNPDLANTLPAGSFPLLIADQHTGRPWKNRLVLIADEARKYKSSMATEEYVSNFVAGMPRSLHVEIVHRTHLIEIAGRQFWRADYTKIDSGVELYQAFICTRLKGFLISWTFTSTSQQELERLADSIKTVVVRDTGGK
jgi:hypothetical protein